MATMRGYNNHFSSMAKWKQAVIILAILLAIFFLVEAMSFAVLVFFSPARDFRDHPIVKIIYPLNSSERAKRWTRWNFWYGYRLFENTVYTEANPTEEADDTNIPYTYTTDSHGFIRNNSNPQDKTELGFKSAGETRVFILGGSTVAGYSTPPEYSISAQLEKILNDSRPSGTNAYYCVVNAGVPAWASRQEYIFTLMVIDKLQPDIIVVLDGYNDFSQTSTWGYGLGAPWSRKAVCAYNTPLHNFLVRQYLDKNKPTRFTSFLEVFINDFFKLYTARTITGFLKTVTGRITIAPTKVSNPTSKAVSIPYGQPLPGQYWFKFVPEGLVYYGENLNSLAQFCQSRGIKCLFALQPTLAVEEKVLPPEESAYLSRVEEKTNGVLQREAKKWWEGARKTFLYLDEKYNTNPSTRFADLSHIFSGEKERMYLPDTCHYTKKGNHIVARELAKLLLNYESAKD